MQRSIRICSRLTGICTRKLSTCQATQHGFVPLISRKVCGIDAIQKRFYPRGRFSGSAQSSDSSSDDDLETKNSDFTNPATAKHTETDVSSDISKEQFEHMFKNAASFNEVDPKTPDDIWSTSPYPIKDFRDQTQHSFRPQIDPKETSIILFPGQGTQFVGMGEALLDVPNVREMFSAASSILDYDLLDVCLKGPKTKLSRTEYCQPAVLVSSLAAVERLKEDNPSVVENCVATAGFSVGEIAALVFSGALEFEDAIRFVKVRSEAMQAASELAPGGMMTVFFGPDAKVNFACAAAKEWCLKKKGIEDADCRVANYLFPGCKVIAGHDEALKFIEVNASDFKLNRWKRLPVSGAFHTDMMRPAYEAVKAAAKKLKISDPLICCHSNVDGKVYRDSEHIKEQLPKQMYKAVKWEQTMHILYERPPEQAFPTTYECGPGKTMSTILKQVNAKAWESCHHIRV